MTEYKEPQTDENGFMMCVKCDTYLEDAECFKYNKGYEFVWTCPKCDEYHYLKFTSFPEYIIEARTEYDEMMKER